MMDTESHPLNKAHQQHRRAEAHLRYKRFQEAIQCHNNAAELLLEALKYTNNPYATESITIQHSYHLRQKDLIKHKQEQYERAKKALDQLKQMSKDPESIISENESMIQIEIYKNLNETDSLLGRFLQASSSGSDELDGQKCEEKLSDQKESAIKNLHNLNGDLHSLVDRLIMQIELAKDDNNCLKEKIKCLEQERKKYLNIQDSNQNAFQVVTSSGNDYINTLSALPTDILTGRPIRIDSGISHS